MNENQGSIMISSTVHESPAEPTSASVTKSAEHSDVGQSHEVSCFIAVRVLTALALPYPSVELLEIMFESAICLVKLFFFRCILQLHLSVRLLLV